jgi:predicted amidohydrolase
MTDIVRVAGAQIDIKLADKAGNLRKALDCCREAAEKGARIIIFPELTLTGYNVDDHAEIPPLAESVPGPATAEIQKICRDLDILVLFGLIEQGGNGSEFFNSAALIDRGGVAGIYRKIHLPYLGGDRFLTPGDRPFNVCETRYGRIGWIICYDGSFPECARVLALQGADMVALCTNWPDDPDSACSREYVSRARAVENHVYYLAVNRVGEERGVRFLGRSLFVDCDGSTLAEGSPDREEIIYADIDLDRARDRQIVFEAGKYEMDRMAQRRPEYYRPICEVPDTG